MSFTQDYYYPDEKNPEFIVMRIEGGYQFSFYDKDGNEDKDSMFSISDDVLEPTYKAIGYDGKQASAIEISDKDSVSK